MAVSPSGGVRVLHRLRQGQHDDSGTFSLQKILETGVYNSNGLILALSQKQKTTNFPLGLKPTFQACLISSVLLSGHARLTRCARDLQEARADRREHTCTKRASIMHPNSVYIQTGSIAEHICVVNICVCVCGDLCLLYCLSFTVMLVCAHVLYAYYVGVKVSIVCEIQVQKDELIQQTHKHTHRYHTRTHRCHRETHSKTRE